MATGKESISRLPKVWKDVSFFSDGIRIAANLFVPEGMKPGEKRPGIVTLSGYSGMKDVYGLDVPYRLWQEGYFALAIDYRGFGSSAGERGRHRPLEQAQDTYDALTYLETIEGVDRDRLGLYGTSFGGGNAIWVAAFDERVRVVVASVMVADGSRWMKILRTPWEFNRFRANVREASRKRATTGEDTQIPYMEMIPHDPRYTSVLQEVHQQDPKWVSSFDYATPEALMRYRPEWVAGRISPRPALIIHAENDEICTDEGLSCYEALGEPKKLVVLPKAQHQESYKYNNPEVHEIGMAATLDWFNQYL